MLRLLAPLACALLCACGQKGPLYLPDEGTSAPRITVPTGEAASPAGAPAPAADAQAPGSPDRPDEPRKRIHTP